jgi:hypothetical protein
MVLLEGRDRGDPLILQAKEATASVLDPYLQSSHHRNHGERVVVGQRLMQATPDIFLGWTRGPGGRDFYFRQLWDMKGSVDVATLRQPGLAFYGDLCARALARAHARSGDAVAVSAYLGTSDTFDGAIADFSETYADINERTWPTSPRRHGGSRSPAGAAPAHRRTQSRPRRKAPSGIAGQSRQGCRRLAVARTAFPTVG